MNLAIGVERVCIVRDSETIVIEEIVPGVEIARQFHPAGMTGATGIEHLVSTQAL